MALITTLVAPARWLAAWPSPTHLTHLTLPTLSPTPRTAAQPPELVASISLVLSAVAAAHTSIPSPSTCLSDPSLHPSTPPPPIPSSPQHALDRGKVCYGATNESQMSVCRSLLLLLLLLPACVGCLQYVLVRVNMCVRQCVCASEEVEKREKITHLLVFIQTSIHTNVSLSGHVNHCVTL